MRSGFILKNRAWIQIALAGSLGLVAAPATGQLPQVPADATASEQQLLPPLGNADARAQWALSGDAWLGSESIVDADVELHWPSEMPRPAGAEGDSQTAQQQREAVAALASQPYRGVFYDNDFSYIRSPWYDGFYPGDSLKQLAVPAGGTVDVGGEIRVRYHSEENMRGLGLTGLDDDFWLTRLRLFSDYRMNDYFRFFGEYLYADSGGQQFTNRTIEVNRGEAQNLFIDANLMQEADASLTARLGRQELLYGNQRLISPLDWANTRRTFDGYRLLYGGESWDVDGFFVHPVRRLLSNQGTGQWDGADTDTLFYGVYGTRKGLDIGVLDTYYLGVDYLIPGASFHTLGSRLAGSYEGWLYEFEGGTQFGRNANQTDHTAGFAVAGLGRQLDISIAGTSWRPTLWGWYDYASGEDNFADAGRFGDGFDHLFPLAHKYNGLMDLFGRRNLHDINAQLITPVMGDRVSLMLWYHYFLLDNLTTPYNINMAPFNTVAPAAARELGHEIDVLFTITMNPRNSMLIGYSYFSAGEYYRRTSGGVPGANGIPSLSDAQFFYAQYQMQF